MVKLKFVNAGTSETAIIEVESLKTPIFDVIKQQANLFAPFVSSDETSIKNFLSNNVSLQVLTKRYDFEDIISKSYSFQHIGVSGSMKIGVFVKQQTSIQSKKHSFHHEQPTLPILNTSCNEVQKEKVFKRDLKAIAPSQQLNIEKKFQEDDTDPPQMGIDDFKNYYETIANKAHNRTDVYKDILEQKKLSLEECHVRVKFPDRTILQAKFTNNETSKTLYEFVKLQLHRPEISFQLYFGHPLKVINNSENLYLIKDLKFDKRTSILFETQQKKLPFLKQDIKLESIESLNDIQQSLKSDLSTKKVDGKPLKTENDSEKSKKQKLEDKMAKFLKLSKK